MYPSHFKPLIVVGRQRAGTRFLTNLLNSFDEVVLQGELPNGVMESVVRFIREIEAYYAKAADQRGSQHKQYYKRWRSKKESLLFSIWENASQARAKKATPESKYFGYKRPNNERYFDFYEEAFAFRPPTYVYCIRNFVDNFLSVVSRWPERRIEDVAGDYMASVTQYHKMKGAAPDRVLLFNLDDHVKYGLNYIEKNVIRPLGLKVADDHRKKLKRMRGSNRTEEDLKIPRRKELTTSEQRFLGKHPELEIAFRKLCCPDT